MSAEAMRQEDPRWGELVTLLGWPWKLALALVVSGMALLWLSQAGFASSEARMWNGSAALICLAAAALLALGSSLYTLRGLLRGTAEEPAPAAGVEAETLVEGLRQLLETQQLRVHEATGAASRAVATAAQLSGLASHVEKQFRQTLEQATASGAGETALSVRAENPEAAATLKRLEACAQQIEDSSLRVQHSAATVSAAEEMLRDLPAVAQRITTGAEQLEAAARTVEQLPASTRALSAAAQTLVEQGVTAQSQAARVLQQIEALIEDAMQRLDASPASGSPVPTERLEELVRSLGEHLDRALRNEATMGDAARYLTETTDRFTQGLTELETHVVRLQAMISISGNREAEAAPLREEVTALRQQLAKLTDLAHSLETPLHQPNDAPSLSPAIHAVLHQLGTVQTEVAQLLQEAAALPRHTLPPAFVPRTTKLLQDIQESTRQLHAAAGGTSPAA